MLSLGKRRGIWHAYSPITFLPIAYSDQLFPCKTEAFTTENAERAENGMGTIMLHLSDLCALCGKMLVTTV